jgi:hypothetical protein
MRLCYTVGHNVSWLVPGSLSSVSRDRNPLVGHVSVIGYKPLNTLLKQNGATSEQNQQSATNLPFGAPKMGPSTPVDGRYPPLEEASGSDHGRNRCILSGIFWAPTARFARA